MQFREYVEYSNPEGSDCDIKSSLNEVSFDEPKSQSNQFYYSQLFDLIGILEDIDEEDLIKNYGISMQEYLKPTAETIKKVSEKLNSRQNGRSR